MALARIARRQGEPAAWAWLPIANVLLLPRLAGRRLAWAALLAAPGVNLVLWTSLWRAIARRSGASPSLGWAMLVPGLNLLALGRLAGLPTAGVLAMLTPLLLLAPAANGWRTPSAPPAVAPTMPVAERVARLLDSVRNRSEGTFPDADVVRALAACGPDALPHLVAAIRDPDVIVRWHAAGTIIQLGPAARGEIPALVACLSDASWNVRNACGFAIEKVATPEQVPLLVTALDERNVEVRYHAVRALMFLGPDATLALGRLVQALEDPDADVRRYASRALGGIGTRAQAEAPALLGRMRDADAQVRAAAAASLGLLGTARPDVIAALQAARDDVDRDTRLAAAEALRRLGTRR